MFRRALHQEHGFTLIELLIGMAISGIIMGATFTFLMAQQKYLTVQEQVTEMIQNARAVMDMMSREIQMAGYNPLPAILPFDGITYNAAQLQIRADLNGNGIFTDPSDDNENITYAYDSGNRRITRNTNTGGGAQPLAENVQAFTFAYLDAGGIATATTANIRQMRITITMRTGKSDPSYTANGGYRTYTLTSLVTPRNLGI